MREAVGALQRDSAEGPPLLKAFGDEIDVAGLKHPERQQAVREQHRFQGKQSQRD
jgi:hypothetical protein